MRCALALTIGCLLLVTGCNLAPPDVGSSGLPLGEYTLTVTHDNATMKRTCGCPICRKRAADGQAPMTDTRTTLLIDGDEILAANDPDGKPIALPGYSLTVTAAAVELDLHDEFAALPAGTYILTVQDNGSYATDAHESAADAPKVRVTLARN
jgi:hypothetical protein